DRLHLLVDRARARLAGEPLPPLDNSVLAAPTASVQDSAPSVQSHSAPDADTGSAYETGRAQSAAPTQPESPRAESPKDSYDQVHTSKVVPCTPKPKQTPPASALPAADLPGMRPSASGGAAPAP